MLSDYKVVISDLGGVFIDCLSVYKTCSDILNIDYDAFFNYYMTELDAPFSDGFLPEKELWEKVEKKFGVKAKSNLLEDNFHPVIVEPLLAIYKDLKAKGLRVVTGSNNNEGHWRVSSNLNQFEVFDALYASHLMHHHKPERAFYEYIIEAEKVDPKECIFIDDMEVNLVEPKKMGMKTFLYNLKDKDNFNKLNAFLASL